MPKLPDDMDKASAAAAKSRKAIDDRRAKAAASAEHSKALIRAAANELRARGGEPPLRDDEPVMGFFCRRGRRP